MTEVDAAQKAPQTRQAVTRLWRSVLARLSRELKITDGPPSKDFVERLRVASDQIRRDCPDARVESQESRVESPEEPTPLAPPADPLDGLRLVG
jgi:hypothetical protein